MDKLGQYIPSRLLTKDQVSDQSRSNETVDLVIEVESNEIQDQKHQFIDFQMTPLSPDPISCVTLLDCLQSLVQAGFIDQLSASDHWSTAWMAAANCLNVDELKEVYFKIALDKAKGTRDQILNQIHARMTTSRDLFGRPLPLVAVILAVMEKEPFNSTVSGRSRQGVAPVSVPVIIRVRPAVLALFRRAQRLGIRDSCEVSNGPLFISYVTGGFSYLVFCLVFCCLSVNAVQVPSLLSIYGAQGHASVHEPLSFNAAMLAIFGRIRFPDYVIRTNSPIFRSERQFRQWEAAHELSWAIHEVEMNINYIIIIIIIIIIGYTHGYVLMYAYSS